MEDVENKPKVEEEKDQTVKEGRLLDDLVSFVLEQPQKYIDLDLKLQDKSIIIIINLFIKISNNLTYKISEI